MHPSTLHSSALTLFRSIFALALSTLQSLTARIHALPVSSALTYLADAASCAYSLIRIEWTLARAPHLITPIQLARLSKAARFLKRLTSQTFNFTPFLSSSDNPQSAIPNPQSFRPYRPRSLQLPPASPLDRLNNLLTGSAGVLARNPQPETNTSPLSPGTADAPVRTPPPAPNDTPLAPNHPKDSSPTSRSPLSSLLNHVHGLHAVHGIPEIPEISEIPEIPEIPLIPALRPLRPALITPTPGATLARVCQTLAKLLDKLPGHSTPAPNHPTASPTPSFQTTVFSGVLTYDPETQTVSFSRNPPPSSPSSPSSPASPSSPSSPASPIHPDPG